jgi:hypothetical protein
MIKTEDRERNIQILNEYKEVGVMQLVGDKYGITRERVRQIVSKYGYKKPIKVRLSKEQKRAIKEKKRIEWFWNNATKKDSGCLEWDGLKYPTGYGCVKWKSKNTYSHRVAWELSNGEIPDGFHVCHHCDNPCCINPDHLFLGTVADNMHDRDAKGRGRYGENRLSLKNSSKLDVTK